MFRHDDSSLLGKFQNHRFPTDDVPIIAIRLRKLGQPQCVMVEYGRFRTGTSQRTRRSVQPAQGGIIHFAILFNSVRGIQQSRQIRKYWYSFIACERLPFSEKSDRTLTRYVIDTQKIFGFRQVMPLTITFKQFPAPTIGSGIGKWSQTGEYEGRKGKRKAGSKVK